ncbi:hypothetical protein TrRE_jg5913, partial [Triparma retinervis]
LERQQQERDEGRAPETTEGDSVESWYVVNQHLGLPGLLNKNKARERGYNSVIEVLVDAMSAKSEKEVEPAPWVRPSTTPNFQFPLKATAAATKSNQVSSPPSSPTNVATSPGKSPSRAPSATQSATARPKSQQKHNRPRSSNNSSSVRSGPVTTWRPKR